MTFHADLLKLATPEVLVTSAVLRLLVAAGISWDANRRGRDPWMWGSLAFWTDLIGLVAWLLVRLVQRPPLVPAEARVWSRPASHEREPVLISAEEARRAAEAGAPPPTPAGGAGAWQPLAPTRSSFWGTLSGGHKVAFLLFGAVVVGGLGPWAVLNRPVFGYEGDGWIVALLGVNALAVYALPSTPRARKVVPAALAAFAGFVATAKLGGLALVASENAIEDPASLVEWGLPLAITASVLAFVAAIAGDRYVRRALAAPPAGAPTRADARSGAAAGPAVVNRCVSCAGVLDPDLPFCPACGAERPRPPRAP